METANLKGDTIIQNYLLFILFLASKFSQVLWWICHYSQANLCQRQSRSRACNVAQCGGSTSVCTSTQTTSRFCNTKICREYSFISISKKNLISVYLKTTALPKTNLSRANYTSLCKKYPVCHWTSIPLSYGAKTWCLWKPFSMLFNKMNLSRGCLLGWVGLVE